MKKWFSSHKIALISFTLFIVTYLIAVAFCSEYISFGYNYREKNIEVAKFYFLKLPLWSLVPSVLYLSTVLVKKFIENRKQEEVISNCMIRTPYITGSHTSLFYSLRESSFDNYWAIISQHIDAAIEYMLRHPNEFFIGDNIIDNPGWEENTYFRETIYVNGKKLIVFLRNKTFSVDLHNCVKEITKSL